MTVVNSYGTGFSNDPYLAGIMVADTVEGMQSTGVVASTKVSHIWPLELLRTSAHPINSTSS